MLQVALHILYSLSFRVWVFHSHTRARVRLLGPCFKTGQKKPFWQDRLSPSDHFTVFCSTFHCWSLVAQFFRCFWSDLALWKWRQRKPRYVCLASLLRAPPFTHRSFPSLRHPQKILFFRFLLNDFKSFNSLFKVLFIFPSQYLFAIGFP